MKIFFVVLGLLSLAGCSTMDKPSNAFAAAANSAGRAPASNSTTLKCTGAYDENRGSNLTLISDGETFSISGTAVAGEGFSATVACVGHRTGDSRDGKYGQYATKQSSGCNVDYVKIMKAVESNGSGMLVLARTSGGDTHDNSGYVYRYYHCGT